MKVIVEIPDAVAATIPDLAQLPRLILESYCARGFRSKKFTRSEVGELLGLDLRRTDEFLAANAAMDTRGSEDVAIAKLSRETLP